MAEGFELVRMIRQHLRAGAALLDEGKIDAALGEADAALALDPQSLPAQALRDRIHRVQQGVAASKTATSARDPKVTTFVPYGVNAASWRGFEQRITERRFRALLDTVNVSIVAGDAAAARAALEEARELKPDAPELGGFEMRVAAVPFVQRPSESMSTSRIWVRAIGAAALFLIGLSMFAGLELIRPSGQAPAAAQATAVEPALAPQPRLEVADAPEAEPEPEPVPVGINGDEDFVPAIVTPPEPTRRVRATAGNAAADAMTPVARQAVLRGAELAANDRPVEITVNRPVETPRIVEEPPLRPVREVPDEYVAPAPGSGSGPSPTTSASASMPREPVSPPTRVPSPEPDTPTSAPAAYVVPAAVVTTAGDQGRVEEVLRRYARAYETLDANAARAVWPSVDEKALARAFQDLASQNVSFDTCDIDIRGAQANASCSGQASYVGRVGSREPRIEPRTWRFELRRDGDAWKIETAETRRQSFSTPTSER